MKKTPNATERESRSNQVQQLKLEFWWAIWWWRWLVRGAEHSASGKTSKISFGRVLLRSLCASRGPALVVASLAVMAPVRFKLLIGSKPRRQVVELQHRAAA